MILREDINIRDPFVLVKDGKYYLYGTRGLTCWGEADGFDGYVSEDLEHFEGPFEVFHRPDGFIYDKNYWAPEVHEIDGAFYMFATFNTVRYEMKGTHILRASAPLGPYEPWSEGPVTPAGWNCLDGTYLEDSDGKRYMIFSHEWTETIDGEICAVELSKDLKKAASEPFLLFKASSATEWVKPFQHQKFPGENVFVTDGPFAYRREDGRLFLLWSSFGNEGYAQGLASSSTGTVRGPWVQEKPVFMKDGGHGMVFRTPDGHLKLTLHSPNEHLKEHPVFFDITI